MEHVDTPSGAGAHLEWSHELTLSGAHGHPEGGMRSHGARSVFRRRAAGAHSEWGLSSSRAGLKPTRSRTHAHWERDLSSKDNESKDMSSNIPGHEVT